METLIILGSGCAGLTAAIYAARANLNPLVLEGDLAGGQLTTTSEVENFPGFPTGIQGPELMDHMRKQALRFGARFKTDWVKAFDRAGEMNHLTGAMAQYQSRALIIATGASPRLLGIPGEREMYGGKGVTTCATCDGAFYRDQDVVVVGGGDSACQEALFLTRYCRKITLIHRRGSLRASKIMAQRVQAHPQISLLWNAALTAIVPDAKGYVNAVQVQDLQTGSLQTLPCTGVFLAIGHDPNTAPFREFLACDEQGYFIPASGTAVGTQLPGVYVAGDCVDHLYRQAITAAGLGCQAAILCERWLSEQAS